MAEWSIYLFTAVIALIIYAYSRRDRRNYAKGPTSLPWIGNSFQIKDKMWEKLNTWADQYGSIFSIKIFTDRCYVLNDHNLIREAFNHPDLTGRPATELFTLLRDGPHGVIMSVGGEWTEQRRFTLRHLRDFGFGKKSGEEFIVNEVTEFIKNLENEIGSPISVNKRFNVAVLNTLWMILSGVRYKHDDPGLWGIIHENENILKKLGKSPLVFVAPRLARLIPEFSGWNGIMQFVQNIRGIIQGHLDHHLKDYAEVEEPRDFIDVYLKEIKATTDPESSFYKEAGMRSLMATIADLFAAGSDTTAVTLTWIVFFLARFPECQKKLHDELDEVVGKSRAPCLSDRPRMPYFEAIITEAMRMSSITPNGVFHQATADIKFHDYDIPKGTWIIPNMHYVHHDKKVWSNPNEFQPERFISADGKFKKHEAAIPFSVGKRACLGETLARDSLFLFTTHLYHRFSIQMDEGSKDVSIEPGNNGMNLLTPQEFNVVLTERV